MKVSYRISRNILDWVITTGNIRPKTLSTIREWQRGTKIPTYNQIEKVSKDTHIPLGYFFLETPPAEDIPLLKYRTIENREFERPSRDLMDTIEEMEQIIEWTGNKLRAEGMGSNPVVGKLKGVSDVEVIASSIRGLLGLRTNWYEESKGPADSFKKLRTAMNATGIIVMMNGTVRGNTHRPLDVDEFRAFSMIDTYAPLVFINAADSINGRLFSLLHEYAHICLGRNDLFNDRYGMNQQADTIETFCNTVAAEILVPGSIFLGKWDEQNGISVEHTIGELVRFFHCGPVVIARKALDTHKLNHRQYEDISKDAANRFRERKEQKSTGGDFYNNLSSRVDQRFLNLLFESVSEGTTTYTEAFRLTNTNRMTFDRLPCLLQGTRIRT